MTTKISTLKEHIYCYYPSYLRNNDIDFVEQKLLKIRKNTNLNVLQTNKIIPSSWTKEDYNEFIDVVRKYKKNQYNRNYHKTYTKKEDYIVNNRKKCKARQKLRSIEHNLYNKTLRFYDKLFKENNIKLVPIFNELEKFRTYSTIKEFTTKDTIPLNKKLIVLSRVKYDRENNIQLFNSIGKISTKV